MTRYTRYFIEHYDDLMNEKDAFMIVGKRNNGNYKRDSRKGLNSLELLRTMMKCNMFQLMNLKDILALETTTKIDTTETLRKTLPSNYYVAGVKFENGVMIPDIEYNDDDEDINHYYINNNDDDKYCNGFSEDELFGCKDNNYLEDCSDVFCDFDEED